jgi:eukaryotic-like serine/threonine-protein kinase
MRFLVIDDVPEYRRALRYHLDVQWPDADVDEYQPVSGGAIPSNIAEYDLVLLGYPLAGEADFAWLRALRRSPGCPPVLVFADPSDEFLAVDAMHAGAASYFPKFRVTHQRLVETIRSELGAGDAAIEARSFLGRRGRGKARDYEILETLHSTDLASVYLARAGDGGALLAFKVLRYVPDSGSERAFDRFLQEYEIVKAIDHPNVVRIFDLGIADDHAYIAMEYLPAGSLAERLNGPLGAERSLGYARQIAGALRAIHAAGILHRDLKPGNIMFRDDGTLALIDFGLAKQTALQAAITGAGQIFGTPYYMSPEQGHADPTDLRSDIYSFGCIVYEMLTGERPFVGSSAMGVIYKHANATRPKLNHGLEKFQAPLDRMLAIRPEDRYASVDELLEDLARL